MAPPRKRVTGDRKKSKFTVYVLFTRTYWLQAADEKFLANKTSRIYRTVVMCLEQLSQNIAHQVTYI